jgi:putative ABC transport system substrate-binding protein
MSIDCSHKGAFSIAASMASRLCSVTGHSFGVDKPADLPVQQAIKTELVINLQTAKALGIDMPLSLLLRVTETIE